MDIFELHFNPKKENHVFNTFISEPENEIEKKLGSLYMAGEVTSPLPKPEEFLGKVYSTIKKSFYSQKLNPEASLSRALKAANNLLGEEVKKENVGWLGNFNFAVLSMKDYNLVFTKTGKIRIILIRSGEISDIGKNLNLEDIEPYPVKIFFNVASGRLAENDMLMILSENVFEFIKEKGILNIFASSPDVSPKKIKELLPQSLFTKGEGSKISGLSMIFLFKKEKAKSRLPIIFQPKEFVKKHNIFPVPIIIKPLKDTFEKVKGALPKRKISLPKIKIEGFKKEYAPKKKIILIGAFVVFLLVGFVIFKTAQDKREKDIVAAFNQVNQKVKQAESLLLVPSEEEADKLLKQAFKDIQPLTQKDSSIMPSILSLRETIEGNLERLNKMEKIENPEVVFEVGNFEPKEMLLFAGNLYLYNNTNVIQRITVKTGEKENIELSDNIKNLDSSSEAVLASTEGNKIYYSKKGVWEEKGLQAPEEYNSYFDLFSSYLFNLYFINKNTCEITKYPYLNNFEWGSPKIWHKDQDIEKTCLDPVSAAIDGSIWLLNQDSTITRYYTGEFQENIQFDIFPFPEEFTELNIRNNLYILEPKNNRLIITEKNGKVIRQFQSDKFDALKSFAVSENGKTIYLLNGSTIYKIEI